LCTDDVRCARRLGRQMNSAGSVNCPPEFKSLRDPVWRSLYSKSGSNRTRFLALAAQARTQAQQDEAECGQTARSGYGRRVCNQRHGSIDSGAPGFAGQCIDNAPVKNRIFQCDPDVSIKIGAEINVGRAAPGYCAVIRVAEEKADAASYGSAGNAPAEYLRQKKTEVD